jgi:hypothetical protein
MLSNVNVLQGSEPTTVVLCAICFISLRPMSRHHYCVRTPQLHATVEVPAVSV